MNFREYDFIIAASMIATSAEAAQTVSRIVTVALSRYLNEPIDTPFQVSTWERRSPRMPEAAEK